MRHHIIRAITREHPLFMKSANYCQVDSQRCNHEEVVERIVSDNLFFQYPRKSREKDGTFPCLRRLDALEDNSLVEAITTQPSDGKADMSVRHERKQYKLIWGFCDYSHR